MPMPTPAQLASRSATALTAKKRVRMVGDKLLLNRLEGSDDAAAAEEEGAIQETILDDLLWSRPLLQNAFLTS